MSDDRDDRPGATWRIRSAVAQAEAREGLVVLALDEPAAVPLAITGSGESIWRLIDGRRSDREIARMLAETYAIEMVVALPEVRRFLTALNSNGVIEVAPIPGAPDAQALAAS